jgi:hypothetical protein
LLTQAQKEEIKFAEMVFESAPTGTFDPNILKRCTFHPPAGAEAIPISVQVQDAPKGIKKKKKSHELFGVVVHLNDGSQKEIVKSDQDFAVWLKSLSQTDKDAAPTLPVLKKIETLQKTKILNNFLFGCFKCLRDKDFTPDAGAALLNFLDGSYEEDSKKGAHGAYDKAAAQKHKVEQEQEKLVTQILKNLALVSRHIKDYAKEKRDHKPTEPPNVEPTK